MPTFYGIEIYTKSSCCSKCNNTGCELDSTLYYESKEIRDFVYDGIFFYYYEINFLLGWKLFWRNRVFY